MEIINLNLIPTGSRPVVHASQYDNGRQFRANLFEGSAVYTLTGAETLTFSVRKPDGHIVTEAVTNTSSDYVIVETTTQMCACAGDSFAELNIENGDDHIGTLNLILTVEQSPEEGGDPSESFIHNLDEQIYDAVADQYDSNNVIFDNAPTSGHGTPYTVTSEGIKDAIDNAISGLTIPENITDLADVDVTTPTDGEILVFNNGTWENQANPASTANFGPDYDENTTYNTGGKVIYQGLFYVCNDDNVTGTWDATKWDSLTVADLNGKLLPMSTTEPNSMVADRIEALESALPNYIKQVSGTSVSFAVPCTFFYYYADQWRAYVQFPFIAKNNNYSISLTSVQAENIGDITSKISVIAKYGACFEIETTKTMTALPNQFSVCVGTVNFTITFA